MVRRLWVVVCLLSTLFAIGCGGSSQPVLTGLSLTPSVLSLQVGATEQFHAFGTFSNGSVQEVTNSVTWSSSDTSVATISSAGLATVVGSGRSNITATSSITSSAILTASSPVAVALYPHVSGLTTLQTQQFQASIKGTTNTDMIWSVDGTAGGSSTLGTISTSGLYTAPSTKGSHKVSVTSQADLGKTDSASVAVQDLSGVFTYHYDNTRSGQNPDEILLTPQNVNFTKFGKLFAYPVDGQIYPEPLYVRNVNIPGQGVFNVVYVATEHDSVYAFDADGRVATPLWDVSFLNPDAGITPVPGYMAGNIIQPEVGIFSTPVIDPASNTLYCVAYTDDNGSLVYRLHALDITSGAEKFGGPVVIHASVPGTGAGNDGNGSVPFDPAQHDQRTGLLLVNGVLYFGFASWGDILPFHGWLMAYNATSLQQVGVFNTSPNGYGGAIWQSGAGAAADSDGNVYVITGNGDFDPTKADYGDSFLKLRLGPNGLSLVDYFTPYNQVELELLDKDLGSGGPLLLQGLGPPSHPNLLAGIGKGKTLYLVDPTNMGGFNPNDNSQIVQSIPGVAFVFGTPATWQNYLYFAGAGGYPLALPFANGVLSSTISSYARVFFLFPGAVPVISADGNNNGILWMVHADATNQDNYVVNGPAVLYAYDASNLSTLLYNSTLAGTRDGAGIAVRFAVPTVANGRVYVGTQGELDVYGLLPN